MENSEDYLARAQAAAADESDYASDAAPRMIGRAAIIGAGTMGIGIAMAFANAGIAVTLIDQGQDGLDRGLGMMRKNWDRVVARGALSAEEAAARFGLIETATDMALIGGADVVVEAVWEQMALKKSIFEQPAKFIQPIRSGV